MSDTDDQESADDQDDLEPKDDTDSDSGSDNSAPPKDDSPEAGDKKRVDDLMAKWQTEQATNAKLVKQLERLKASKTSEKKTATDQSEAATAEFIEFTRENTRKAIFDSDPRLAKFGLKPEVITGESLADMKEAFEQHLKLVSSIESQTRNEVLVEHGLQPEVETGASEEGAKSFDRMSEKEFEDFLKSRDSMLR